MPAHPPGGEPPQPDAGQLAAVAAIEALKARYFRYLDTRDWTAMYSVFSVDAVMDMREELASLVAAGLPVAGDGLLVGRDVIVAAMASGVAGTVSAHHGHMPEIQFHGPDRASGLWAMEDVLLLPRGAPASCFQACGHYHETYIREPDREWRIAELRLTRLVRLSALLSPP